MKLTWLDYQKSIIPLVKTVVWLCHFPAIVGQGTPPLPESQATQAKPFLDKVPLIYVVRILKDIDHSTLSNNLFNFSPKVWQAESLI